MKTCEVCGDELTGQQTKYCSIECNYISPARTAYMKRYMKAYHQRPEVKERIRELSRRPEAKVKNQPPDLTAGEFNRSE